MVAGWWMSLPWAALLKRLSIRLQPHGPSHLIRSQWKPVALCHHSYSIGRRCNRGSHRSRELDTLRKPFRCKERILCDSCKTPSHMAGAALGQRGERCVCVSEREREMLRRRSGFPSFMESIQNIKLHSRFYQSNCRPIHLNYTWMRMRTITALENSKAFCRFDSVSPSVYPAPPPSSLISLHWYLHVNDFYLSASLVSFVFYLHVSDSSSLMVLRRNESNLPGDSRTILPAITRIHSGQWILMTMKPGSCEATLQSRVSVMLFKWQSCSIHL